MARALSRRYPHTPSLTLLVAADFKLVSVWGQLKFLTGLKGRLGAHIVVASQLINRQTILAANPPQGFLRTNLMKPGLYIFLN
jgi:hypothetical protein